MGSRHYFVARIWGVPDVAQSIYRQATRTIEGQAPFFTTAEQKNVFNLRQTLNRLQMVDDLGWRVDAHMNPFADDVSDMQEPGCSIKRCC